jgi:prepilin-type N-terminal cleavage/methylation domain-containing protein
MRASFLPACRRAAYTLVELLTVLAIIAILIGLTTGAYFRARAATLRNLEVAHWRDQRRLGESPPRSEPIRVLFIGNSYTASHDLPQMVAALAQSAGNRPALEVEAHMVPGATLEDHWNNPDVLAKIRRGGWDFVVLQEQSMRPIIDRPAMHEYARKLDGEIRQQGAFTVFFLTWARAFLPRSQEQLTRAYVLAARDRGAEVAPAGVAWQRSLASNPQRVLHEADGSPPNPTGSYLAACVFYAQFCDRSPEGLTGRMVVNGREIVNLPDAEARELQRIAWQAAKDMKKELKPYAH